MAEPIMSLRNLTKTFKTKGGEITAVDNVSFDLHPGDILCLVGESGSGKTTVARMAAGMIKPTRGEVLFEGNDINKMGKDDFHTYRRAVQIIHQDPYGSLNPIQTIGSILRAPLLKHKMVKGRREADKRVRQALAHAIDREQNGFVSLAESGIAVAHMSGMSDNLSPTWLSEDVQSQLNPYEYDLDKATALMEEAGWTKDGDTWMDPDGNPAEYELLFPAEFADWSAAGTNVAEQLTAFGLNVSPRPITYTQIGVDVQDGKFQMAIQGWGNSNNPHPHYSYFQAFFFQNIRTDAPEGRGMDFPLVQETEVMGEVDIDRLVVATGEGMSADQQRELVGQAALVFNELLNVIPLWERYGNNAVLEGVRVQPWPADDAPIMQNSFYADGIVTILMLDGTLQPVE